ncbi:hypothetical protein VNO77_30759 [Canavalia gladiata]|uniref:Uncharacterized protein n=1 Tax=Canavalia gladiata TaxID=3824 RepID=A0AAN9Q7E7_CANGL
MLRRKTAASSLEVLGFCSGCSRLMKVPSSNPGLEEKETLLFQMATCRQESATDSKSGVLVPFDKMGEKLDSAAEDNNGVVNPEDGKPGEVEKSDKMDEDPKQDVQAQAVEVEPKVKDKEIPSVKDEES